MVSRPSPIAAATSLAVLLAFYAGLDCFAPLASPAVARADGPPLDLLRFLARSREPVAMSDGLLVVREKPVAWEPHKTAIIICDMWDRHTCRGAERREAEIAPKMNLVVAAARKLGVLIVHAPSGCMEYYKDTPQRRRAEQAPADPKLPAEMADGCRRLPGEPSLPIDDSDGGCDCTPPCDMNKLPRPWTRQIAVIEIAPQDAVSDSGREIWNLFAQHGIENIVLMGVHTNMCVAGRPFGLRQWASHGKQVVLARDLTDSLYNRKMSPFVSHRRGTELVIEHIETHICPSITSADLLGQPTAPRVVFLLGEDEYHTAETLPAFAAAELTTRGIHVTLVRNDPANPNHFPGIAALREADLVVLSARRRVLAPDEIAEVHAYLDSGRPLVGIRTASHAFQGKTLTDENAAWRTFDVDVLGANYLGHFNNKSPSGGYSTLGEVTPEATMNPLVSNLAHAELRSTASLYKNHDLAKTVTVLMTGHPEGQSEVEPVAWTNTYHGARIFYTSLGGPDDFQNPLFRRLLLNAVFWGLDRELPPDLHKEGAATPPRQGASERLRSRRLR